MSEEYPAPPVTPGPDGLFRGTPLRRRLLRRLQNGDICGRIKADGNPCLGTPLAVGRYCLRCDHAGGTNRGGPGIGATTHGAGTKVASVVIQMLQANMSTEDAALIGQMYDETATLADVAALIRLRIQTLQGRYRDGQVKDADYEKGFLLLSNELRKTLEAQVKIDLGRHVINKSNTDNDFGPDAFDPTSDETAPAVTTSEGGTEGGS